MLLQRLLGFIFGYVSFTARSGFGERFINLCRLNNIQLQNLKSQNSVLFAQTDIESYKKIRPIAKKSGMKVKISRKHGLPFLFSRHKNRFGLAVGAVLCALFVLFFSTRIWRIEVTGNNRVSSEEIIAVFYDLGVYKGAASDKINASEVEAAALRKLPEISWLNINISGCTAMIEVRETVKKPETDNDNTPVNLVAARDGQLIILRPFNGTAEAVAGSPVLKGDLLISGIEENKDLSADLCRADGYAVARTNRSSEYLLPSSFKAAKTVANKKHYTLHFLFFDIPLGKYPSSGFAESSFLSIKNVMLPVGITETSTVENNECNCILNKKDAVLLATLRFSEARLEEFRGMEVENDRVSVQVNNNAVLISGEYDCIENIGVPSPIEIEYTH